MAQVELYLLSFIEMISEAYLTDSLSLIDPTAALPSHQMKNWSILHFHALSLSGSACWSSSSQCKSTQAEKLYDANSIESLDPYVRETEHRANLFTPRTP